MYLFKVYFILESAEIERRSVEDVASDELQKEIDESDRLAEEVVEELERGDDVLAMNKELADDVEELNSQMETMDRIAEVNKLENQLEDLKEEVQAAVEKGNAFDVLVLSVNVVSVKYVIW